MARIGWIFAVLYAFSFCGFFAVTLGYDFFHATNPSGLRGIFFLLFGGGTLFLGLHLIAAFTDGPPAWYTSTLSPMLRQPETDRPKRLLVIVYTSIYVVFMTGLIGRFSLERIALPLAIGLLTFLVLTSLLRMFIAFRLIWKKDGKISNSGDKAS